MTALKRQYYSNGEICDILALDKEGFLVIIKLKNCEDRYIVQQLTRYYHSLLIEKPFQSQVNYEHPPRMVAVAPSFHRHNLVNRIYNKLEFQFLRFDILCFEQKFYLLLKNLDILEDLKFELPYQKLDISDFGEDISAPPKVLLEHLGGHFEDQRQKILSLRHKILSFDRRMQEITTAKSIHYGTGKTKLCAELYFDKKQSDLVLLLWIPLWRYRKPAIGRHRIWTDWTTVLYFGHVVEGLGKRKPWEYWKSIPREEWPKKYGSMHEARS